MIYVVAKYIRKSVDLDQCALQIYGDVNKVKILQDSLDSYRLTAQDIREPLGIFDMDVKIQDPKWTALVQLKTDYNSKIFHLMCGAPYEWGACLEDYRNCSLPTTANLLQGLRQRMYGLIFFEKPGALNDDKTEFVMTVEEWCMTGQDSLQEPKRVKPIMPPKQAHPGLKALWYNQKNREIGRPHVELETE